MALKSNLDTSIAATKFSFDDYDCEDDMFIPQERLLKRRLKRSRDEADMGPVWTESCYSQSKASRIAPIEAQDLQQHEWEELRAEILSSGYEQSEPRNDLVDIYEKSGVPVEHYSKTSYAVWVSDTDSDSELEDANAYQGHLGFDSRTVLPDSDHEMDENQKLEERPSQTAVTMIIGTLTTADVITDERYLSQSFYNGSSLVDSETQTIWTGNVINAWCGVIRNIDII